MKTITLPDNDDNPVFTVLEGEHDAKTFNEAYRAEGWAKSDKYTDKDLQKGFFTITDSKWERHGHERPAIIPAGAKLYTFAEW